MKYSIVLFVFSFSIACAQENPTSVEKDIPVLAVSMYDSPSIDKEVALNDPYELEFKVEKNANGQFVLITNVRLNGGSFYVSPFSTGDFKGKFHVEVAPNKDLVLGADFKETPHSKEVIDPHRFVNGPVNWVTEDTRYEYPLKVNSKEDFQIGGKIIFVIEPKCTLEEIPIMFKYKSGVLTAEKWKC